ncbi:MAG: gluconokinase [Spirulina sp. SIO3F2]|nr:gluconokinase [Spirulina sp. SIO3F2]
MGVSGCGKSTVGQALADRLGWPFYDGDDFHPAANIEKMAQGIPLMDSDRFPWLESIHQHIAHCQQTGKAAVLACSALKHIYRQQLRGDLNNIFIVYLQGGFDLIRARLQARHGHFMKADLLHSQFADLEEPQDAIAVDIDQPLNAMIATIVAGLKDCAIMP